jgi:hypothetical protein
MMATDFCAFFATIFPFFLRLFRKGALPAAAVFHGLISRNFGHIRRRSRVAANLTQIYFLTSENSNRTEMEPENAIKTTFYNFAFAEVDGDIHRSPRGVNNHGQTLLAEQSYAECTRLIWQLTWQPGFCARRRGIRVRFATGNECK